MTKKIILVAIIALIIGGGLGYFGKALVSNHHKTTGLYHKGRMLANKKKKSKGATGTVVSDSNNTVTIKLNNGSTEIVYLNSNTSYSKITPASSSNITTGTKITALGTKNTNGSLNAKTVHIQ